MIKIDKFIGYKKLPSTSQGGKQMLPPFCICSNFCLNEENSKDIRFMRGLVASQSTFFALLKSIV